MSSRLDFVRLLGGVPLAANLAAPAAPAAPQRDLSDPDQRLDAVLVLSGGGSRGAYEAGVIAALVRVAGVADGERLPGIDAVVGTSIGSLNSYLVATAQYRRLAALWQTIARRDLFRIKHRFKDIADASSGLLNRIYEALALERGLVTNLEGILDRDTVAHVIGEIVADARTPLIPLLFTATNLSDERAEVFYRSPAPIAAEQISAGQAAIQSVVGRDTRAREATDGLLLPALLASTAIPLLFDPVEIAFNGVTSQYIDGGIADNTPVDVARIVAKNVYAVLVDPRLPPHAHYRNGFDIGFAAFGVAQRRILETALRTASLESEGKRLFSPTATPEQRTFLEQIFDSALFTIRPATELALDFADFGSQAAIDAAYARGFEDAVAGWQPYRREISLAALRAR